MTFISIIIPVKPGLEPQAVRRIESLGFLLDSLEILISEGTNPSAQRNEAVRQATGEVVYFLDDDSIIFHDSISRIQKHFSDSAVVAVGGPSITPFHDSLLQQCIGAALESPLGAGGVRNRYRSFGEVRETTEKELILCNLAIRREAFLSCGGFDERLYPNEENEFLDRLSKGGGKILHDPELIVERSQRPTLAAFARQMFRYGQGRGRQTRIPPWISPLSLFSPFCCQPVLADPSFYLLLPLPCCIAAGCCQQEKSPLLPSASCPVSGNTYLQWFRSACRLSSPPSIKGVLYRSACVCAQA